VRQNPSLSGVIDVVDFAAERNGERDINPAKLREVVETFSDSLSTRPRTCSRIFSDAPMSIC
jgi:hypothetical protein